MHSAIDPGFTAVPDVFDASLYPRTYRVSMRNRVWYGLLGAVVAALGLVGAWYFATGHETKTAQEAVMLTAVCLAFMALGAVLILYMFTTKVVLRADAIEARDFLFARKLRRDDIAGRRSIKWENRSIIQLLPKRAGLKPVKITPLVQTDALFGIWIATLPDLDEQALEKSMSAITANREIGRTPEERIARLTRARNIAKVFTAAAVVVSVWGLAFPRPYEVVIAVLAALPLIALALSVRSGRLYQVVGRRNDARANLAWVLIAPTVALAARAVFDIKLLDWIPALAAAAVVAVVATLAIAAVDHKLRSRKADLLAMLLFCAVYAFGALVEGNTLFDKSPSQVFQATVVGKRKTSGKTTSYYLRLTRWGPRKAEDEVSVRSAFYNSTAPGQRVCVVLRAGALEMPWFFVDACG